MAHGIVIAGAALLSAGGSVAVAAQDWAAFALTVVTIISSTVALIGVRGRRRRLRAASPKPPPVNATKHQWEIYAAQLEQYLKDQQEGSNG